MREMIKYEWKKIWKSRLTQLSVTGCCLFLVFCVYSSIMQISAVDTTGAAYSGMNAVKVLKRTQQNMQLTQEAVDKLVKQYLDYLKNPETSSDRSEYNYLSESIYRTFYWPNRELFSLITNVYREQGNGDDMKKILEKNMGRDFLQARKDRDENYIDLKFQNGFLTREEADYWKQKSDNIGQYTYGYQKGWSMILDARTWPVLIMMIVCIGIAPLFAGEYQSKCDSLLLCMKHGKNKLISAKIITSWLYATCVYWGITAAYVLIYLGLLGTAGADLPIQLKYPAVCAGYSLTMVQAVILVLVLAYAFTLGMMGITILMSALLKNTYAVIITAFLLLIVPTFLSPVSGGYIWNHALSLVPAKIADFSFESYTAYTFGNKVLNWPAAAILINTLCTLIFSIAAHITFKKHQVNK